VISLAGGLPAPDSFPTDRIATVAAGLLANNAVEVLQYSTTEGHPALREWIAHRAGAERGRLVDPDDVVITHGSQQALDLLAKVLIDPGTTVAIDEPGYVGAIQALSLFEPDFLPVPVDRDGMQVEVLAELLAAGARPRLLYTVVNFQNPTGATLSAARRARLAQLADEYGFVIVEDDPYGVLRFAGDALPSIAQWSDRVVSLGTFSKLVVPGFRVGWMIAPAWLRPMVVRAKQGADLHTNSFGQAVLAELVSESAWLADHTEALVRIYGARMRALADGIDAEVGPRLALNRPDGGMFLRSEEHTSELQSQFVV
jgi:2-aminoadipate transaminase